DARARLHGIADDRAAEQLQRGRVVRVECEVRNAAAVGDAEGPVRGDAVPGHDRLYEGGPCEVVEAAAGRAGEAADARRDDGVAADAAAVSDKSAADLEPALDAESERSRRGGGADVVPADGAVVQEQRAVGVDPTGLGIRVPERVPPGDAVVADRRADD